MFVIAIRYLNGWVMAAADGAKKEQAEWPPHPDRVFMALAAAWFETGEDTAEGAALRWLEDQDPPAIAASDACHRELVTSFVPVNDNRASKKLPNDSDLKNLKHKGLGLLPEFRSRQPRSFPVVIPNDSIVHFIWSEPLPFRHKAAMESLLANITYIGHSASLAQAWIVDHAPDPRWLPTNGLVKHRLRVPYSGRLTTLKQRLNRDKLLAYHDISGEINEIKEVLKEIKAAQPYRADWNDFPDVLILKDEPTLKQNRLFSASKSGDAEAAATMLKNILSPSDIARIQRFIEKNTDDGSKPKLAAVHAYENNLNAIPAALARTISEISGNDHATDLRQSNIVAHTGANGFSRLARQALFIGEVEKGETYVLVDDFVGQGGTLANLRGYIIKRGGHVAAAIVLSGKSYSATIAPSNEQLKELRKAHGRALEQWWRSYFGHTFDRLTQSEARYLSRSPNADRIRERIIEAKLPRNFQSHYQGPTAQRRCLNQLESERNQCFPNGTPPSQRPNVGQWQGYGEPKSVDVTDPPFNHFDSNLIILRLLGKRISLPTTLKLTGALRGALLKHCEIQPPPEWLTGHTPNGYPSRKPHLALMPMPFVGSQHSDGSIMGIAVALPLKLDGKEVARCLASFLYDKNSLSVSRRLFDGEWFECNVEQETRERPPLALRPERWTRKSRVWASVTPVVLDRHYDGKERWKHAANDIKTACERSGLPRPDEVMLHPVSLVEGVFHSREFPRMNRKSDGGLRSHSHAVLIFGQEVTGPILVGAGRFRGYGLCLPID